MPNNHEEHQNHQLVTQDGTLITSALDSVLVTANLENQAVTTRDGESELNYADAESSVNWDSADSVRKYGEALFTCKNGNMHLAGDLLLRAANGTTTPYLGGIQPHLTLEELADMPNNRRLARATELLTWLIGATGEYQAHLISAATLDRISSRAWAYAKAENLAGIIKALQTTLLEHGLNNPNHQQKEQDAA